MEIVWILLITLLFIIFELKLYAKYCFKSLDFELNLSKREVFEGDNLNITQVISNKKFLPVMWLEVQFLMSRNLIFDDNEISSLDENYYQKSVYSMLPYEKITRNFKVTAAKRGYYKLTDFVLTMSDIFVKYKYLFNMNYEKDIYVYPKLIHTREFELRINSIMGNFEVNRFLIDDPFLLKGIRDYNQYDSMKTLNWMAYAKTGELKVNEFNSSSERQLLILLNIQGCSIWDSEESLELTISIAAALSSKCLQRGIPTSLCTNGINTLTGNYVFLPYKSSKDQLHLIYKNLACIDLKKEAHNFSSLLKKVQNRKEALPLCIVITHYYSRELENELLMLQKNNTKVKLILVKPDPPELKVNLNLETYIWR